MAIKKVLIIYYSYSSQTRKIIQAFASGLQESGIAIEWRQLKPKEKISFPLGSVAATFKMMVETFFRKRIAIKATGGNSCSHYDLVVLAGPTWSYNPSGPVLSYFDESGGTFENKRVLPIISCRGYWRIHYWQLKYMLKKRRANVLKPVVFLHTGPEPWRTIGVFLKLAGKMPESGKSWISRRYQKFGHTRQQVEYARGLGLKFGRRIKSTNHLEDIKGFTVGDV